MKKEENKSNSLKIKTEDIIALSAKTAKNCYGVVAIADKEEVNIVAKTIKKITKGKMEEGVYVVRYPRDIFSVTIYLIMARDIKITEALRECQKSILYALNKKYPKLCKEVNVYAIGLR